jgi:hypothetical protein
MAINPENQDKTPILELHDNLFTVVRFCKLAAKMTLVSDYARPVANSRLLISMPAVLIVRYTQFSVTLGCLSH